jgi:hypothetical protein
MTDEEKLERRRARTREYMRALRARDPEGRRAYQRQWYRKQRADPEKRAQDNAKRLARYHALPEEVRKAQKRKDWTAFKARIDADPALFAEHRARSTRNTERYRARLKEKAERDQRLALYFEPQTESTADYLVRLAAERRAQREAEEAARAVERLEGIERRERASAAHRAKQRASRLKGAATRGANAKAASMTLG